MNQKLADRYMGRNQQAMVLLEALSNEEISAPDNVWITTKPYGNCREQGFVVSISKGFDKITNVAFFEHRNSDALCALRWEGRLHITGVVRVDDIPEETYPTKWSVTKSWPYMSIADAMAYMRSVVEEIVNND